jgi:hypothetical protein
MRTPVHGRFIGLTNPGKNYRKRIQKSMAEPGSWRGMFLQIAGKRKNYPVSRMMVVMFIAGISPWAVAFSAFPLKITALPK